MRQLILESLDYKFKYDEGVCKRFLEILDVRYGKNSEFYSLFQKFLTSSKNRDLPNAKKEFLIELKRLNLMNLNARLTYLEENHIPETVVIAYLKLLQVEIEHPHICSPSMDLIQAEEKMLHYLLNEARFNYERTGFNGISNTNFRLVLQTWYLYPEFQKSKENCEELLECLSLTPFEF